MHGGLPNGDQGEEEELMKLAEGWRAKLGINEKALKEVPKDLLQYVLTTTWVQISHKLILCLRRFTAISLLNHPTSFPQRQLSLEVFSLKTSSVR